PHQDRSWVGSVHASNRRSGVAWMTLRTTRAIVPAAGDLGSAMNRSLLFPSAPLLDLVSFDVARQGVEVARPEPAIVSEPHVDRLERERIERAVVDPAVDVPHHQPGLLQ